jgi:hypothetical protein
VARSAPGGTLLSIAVVLLILAALDSLATGAWAALRPGDLFEFLQTTGSPDALLLCRALGALAGFQGVCLLFAAFRPAANRFLVLLPFSGRVLFCGVWLWLLGSDRVRLPTDRLELLLLHDAVWLPIFCGFLLMRQPAPSSTVKEALPCLDSSSPSSSPSAQPGTLPPLGSGSS